MNEYRPDIRILKDEKRKIPFQELRAWRQFVMATLPLPQDAMDDPHSVMEAMCFEDGEAAMGRAPDPTRKNDVRTAPDEITEEQYMLMGAVLRCRYDTNADAAGKTPAEKLQHKVGAKNDVNDVLNALESLAKANPLHRISPNEPPAVTDEFLETACNMVSEESSEIYKAQPDDNPDKSVTTGRVDKTEMNTQFHETLRMIAAPRKRDDPNASSKQPEIVNPDDHSKLTQLFFN